MGRTLRSSGSDLSVPLHLIELARSVDLAFNGSTWYTRKSRIVSSILRRDHHDTSRIRKLHSFISQLDMPKEQYIDLAIIYLVSGSSLHSSLSLASLCSKSVYEAILSKQYIRTYGMSTDSVDTSYVFTESDIDYVLCNIHHLQGILPIWDESEWCSVILSSRNRLHPAVLYAVYELRRGIELGWIEVEGWTHSEIRSAYTKLSHTPEIIDSPEWAWIHSF